MDDQVFSLSPASTLVPAVRTADANGATVDLKGFEAATVVIHCGAEGDTLSSTVFIEFKVQHSDNGSDWAAVAQADIVGATVATGGVIAKLADNADAPAVIKAGYIGGKRYIRVVDDRTGTHTNGTPTQAVVVRGMPRHV